ETSAKHRHEYVFGEVYAMVGSTIAHSRITMNVSLSLGNQLAKNPCEVFGPDAKIKITSKRGVRFFYPDVSIVCDSNPDKELFQESPKVVIEVLSKSTRRQDLGDKKDGYLELPSLDTYICLEQSKQLAIVFQRTALGTFEELEYEGKDAFVLLPSIDGTLSLTDAYRNVELVEEKDDHEIG
ncbi:MAG: Uma2 family endonuclease, partial [Planctomycetota bacterium]